MSALPPVSPTRDDPLVAGGSALIGGPLGVHAARRRRRYLSVTGVVLLLTAVTSFAGWVQKSGCRDERRWANNYQYTRLCYSDVEALYFSEGLVNGKIPYRDHPVEYPVVIGGIMELAAEVAKIAPLGPHGDATHRAALFFDVTALLLAGCALVVAWTTVRLAGRRRPWDAAMVAVAPVLVIHAFTNWDLAAVALTGVGLYLWSRRHPAWAGVALGLGVATKAYPLLILLALFLVCLRTGHVRMWARTAVATVTTTALVYVPVYLWVAKSFPYPGTSGCAEHPVNATLFFVDLNTQRVADWDSLWFALQHFFGYNYGFRGGCGAAPTGLNLLSLFLFLALLSGVAGVTLLAPRRPRLPQVCFLVLLAFLLSNKVDSPQYVLWLLPLAVLARPRWGLFLGWQASEAVVLFTRFYFFAGGSAGQGLPVGLFIVAVLVRDLLLLTIAGAVIREILHPERDVVRRAGVDDPAGGALDAAPDTPTWSTRRIPQMG